jgi:hypothetical protein
MTSSGSEQDGDRGIEPVRRSAAAEAAALRWQESQPDDPAEPTSTAPDRPSMPGRPVDRRSASAEAAALRWQQRHPDADEG